MNSMFNQLSGYDVWTRHAPFLLQQICHGRTSWLLFKLGAAYTVWLFAAYIVWIISECLRECLVSKSCSEFDPLLLKIMLGPSKNQKHLSDEVSNLLSNH
jgi:hypothetical protein